MKNDVSCVAKCQIIEQLIFHSFHEEEIYKVLVKNIARTMRRQLDGQHLLFGEYVQY